MKRNQLKGVLGVILAVAAIPMLCGLAAAANDEVKGVINGRSGNTMTVQTQDSRKLTVVLTAGTKVQERKGLFHKRHKDKAVTALIPGLSVHVKGSYNAKNELIADSVSFDGDDLKTAQDIQAGLDPTQQQQKAQEQQIQAQQKVSAEHAAEIKAQEQQIQAQQKVSAEHAAEIAAANKRFGELGQYNIMDEVTVHFGNGKVEIEDQYKPELLKLAQKAKGITGYVIQVQGYASKVGSAALNQKLSSERAANVTSFLEQQGQIPLTHMLAPGAMGTSEQVAPNDTEEGQAENRRVVVRILLNKGIAGI